MRYFPISILRFSNVYGPWSAHKHSVVAKWIQTALREEKVIIHGNGSHARDFIYVNDVVQSIQNVVFEQGNITTMNVCTGKLTTMDDLALEIGKSLSFYYNYSIPPTEQAILTPRYKTRVKALLKTTNLDVGLKETVEWYKKEWKSAGV